MHVNFISSRDTGETRIYYIWSDNVSMIQGENTNDIIKKKINSFLHNYQEELKMIKEAILYLKVLIYWIINFIEYV